MYENKKRKLLATDLDGTFIPFDFGKQFSANKLSGNGITDDTNTILHDVTPLQLQVNALEQLSISHASGHYQLLYVTGRDEHSVLRCIDEHHLPEPDFIFCDVGTKLLERKSAAKQDKTLAATYESAESFHRGLHEITNGILAHGLTELICGIKRIELQEPSKQGVFKRSYYCHKEHLDIATSEIRLHIERNKIPYQVVCSIDPFNGDGLIDLLPRGVDKGFALKWWATEYNFPLAEMVYAGDSGNDIAAFKSGAKSVIVGNASQQVINEVLDYHRNCNTLDRVHVARNSATSGVFEGCKKFGIVD